MNKHFVKTLKRVCRDVEELADRGQKQVEGYGPNTPEVNLYMALLDARSAMSRATGCASAIGFDESALSDAKIEPQSEQTAQTQQEAAQP